MRFSRNLAIVLLALSVSSLAAYYQGQTTPELVTATNAFLQGLAPDQAARARFVMTDEERFNWHFIPKERKGLPLKDMKPYQRALAQAMLSTGLSQRGAMKASAIMSLEQILFDMENGRPIRDPELYFFTVFGEPSTTGAWGWRVEGHHLSVNVTMSQGKVIASSPTFFGTNPAEVKTGPRAGLRVLAREEDLARELLMALDAKQRTTAIIEAKAPADIITGNSRTAELAPAGLPGTALTPKQADMLYAVVEEYANRMPPDVAAATMASIRQAGAAKLHFAWAGGQKRGEPHYYRIQGPAFLIEYDNTQNDANHIHSVWRDLKNDFGVDVLKMHYKSDHAQD